MRLFEFENELGLDGQHYNSDIAVKVLDFIKKNCGPWLATAGFNREVYRGIALFPDSAIQPLDQSAPNAAFVKNIRTDRLPLNSRPTAHQWLNHIIELAGGIANRSNSAFVIANEDTAEQYGDSYVFIPVGNFHYTWHSQWEDWYTALDGEEHRRYMIADTQQLKNLIKSDEVPLNDIIVVIPHLDGLEVTVEFSYRLDGHIMNDQTQLTLMQAMNHKKAARDIRVDQGLTEAIDYGHEIMIKSNAGLYVAASLYDLVCEANL